MDTERSATRSVTVTELQSGTGEVLEHVDEGGTAIVSEQGKILALLVPPGPAEEHLNKLVEEGILDPRALTEPYTAKQMLKDFGQETRSQGGPSLTDIVISLREAEGER